MIRQVPRHFLDLDQIDAKTLRALISEAAARKAARKGLPQGATDQDKPLDGHVLAQLFEKQSTRTRVSFQVGMTQLGGQVLTLNREELQLGRGETISDTAQVLSRYVDAIMIRTTSHDTLLELASGASVPVINGLTNLSHPCQIIADILTYEEHRGPIKGRKIAWIGDGNNVCASWIHAAAQFDFTLAIAAPKKYQPADDLIKAASAKGGRIEVTENIREAADRADCLVTDTWVSMGDKDADERRKLLNPFQIDASVMACASKDAIFMHCLPAHRGEEMTADVIDGPQSVVFDEAENRLHAQKAILLWCLKGLPRSTQPLKSSRGAAL